MKESFSSLSSLTFSSTSLSSSSIAFFRAEGMTGDGDENTECDKNATRSEQTGSDRERHEGSGGAEE